MLCLLVLETNGVSTEGGLEWFSVSNWEAIEGDLNLSTNDIFLMNQSFRREFTILGTMNITDLNGNSRLLSDLIEHSLE